MGVYKRGKTWCVRIWHQGQKVEKAIGPDKNVADAVQKKLEEQRAFAIASGQSSTGLGKVKKARNAGVMTLSEAFERYLLIKESELKSSTVRTYRDNFSAHLRKSFGSLPLSQITRERIIEFQNRLRKGDGVRKAVSATRINNLLNLVRTILNQAVEDELIPESPALKVKRLREEDPNIDPLNLDELSLVFRHMDQFYVPIFTVLAWSGMRPNELKALRWEDIDWHRDEIRISRGIVRKTESTTKTKSSKRVIQMHPEVRRVLKDQQGGVVRNLQGVIFCSKKGDTLSHHLDDVWRKALKKACLRHRPSYQLRHTWASMALMAGEDPLWVAKMLGHSNAAITFKHYARFIPSERHGKAISGLVMKRDHDVLEAGSI
jgi:integrase